MRLSLICEESFDIFYVDEEDNWEAADIAFKIANNSGIRISRNKSLLALAAGKPTDYKFGQNNANLEDVGEIEVLGAVWYALEEEDTDNHRDKDSENNKIVSFSFDIAVDHRSRSRGLISSRIGPKLIDTALEAYKQLKSLGEADYIKVWVVNHKLARYLEEKYGFEPTGSEWSQNNPFMTYY